MAANVCLSNRTFDRYGDSSVKLGFLPPYADASSLTVRVLRYYWLTPLVTLAHARICPTYSSILLLTTCGLSGFNTLIWIPVFFIRIIQLLTIFEVLALQAATSCKMVDEAYPYVVWRILADAFPVFRAALFDVFIDSKTNRLRWNRLSTLLSRRSSYEEDPGLNTPGRVAVSRSSLNGMVNCSLSKGIEFALSERGSSLRAALVNKIVDTTDAVQLPLQIRFARATRGFIPSPMDIADYWRLQNAINISTLLHTRVPELAGQTQDAGRLNAIRTHFGLDSRGIVGSNVDRSCLPVLQRVYERSTRLSE